jgi:hypothetical protein
MPQPKVKKTTASQAQNLDYGQQLSQTMLGLYRASKLLITLLPNVTNDGEKWDIDTQIKKNESDWSKVLAALILFDTKDIEFKPPTAEELKELTRIVAELDGLIATQLKTHAIITVTVQLMNAFSQSQA